MASSKGHARRPKAPSAQNSYSELLDQQDGYELPAAATTATESSMSVAGSSQQQQQQHQLTLATFEQSNFDVASLVSSLSESVMAECKTASTPSGFDPAPLIATFESAVDQLLPLRDSLASRATQAEAVVASAEKSYNAKLQELKRNFEAVSGSYASLETRISEVGRTAIRIGEQLESIDRLKTRASDAHDLISFYFDLADNDTSRLEALRKENREGRAKVALLARRLLAVAKEVETMPGGEKTRDHVEKYCEKFEKEMLRLFDRYYRNGDPRGMGHCARVLLDFNGGQSCVQMYVNQHDYFITQERIQEGSDIIDSSIWEALPNPDALPPKDEPRLSALYTDLKQKVAEEASIIQAVFPNPPLVMQVFLQRVFAQVIQIHIEQLISVAASSSSTLAHLRVIHLAHQLTFALVQDLKSADLFKSATVLSSSLVSGSNSTLSNTVAAMLDQSFEELFVPYIEAAKYLDKECTCLNELYASYLLRFLTWHKEQNKGKPSTTKTVFDKFVNQIASATTAQSAGSSSTSPALGSATNANKAQQQQQQTDGPSSLASIKALMKLPSTGQVTSSDSNHSSNPVAALNLTPVDGALSLNTSERMLRWHAEAVGRMVDLSAPGDVPKNAFTLLRVLTDSYSRAYVETALDTALSAANAYDTKLAGQPDLNHLSVVQNADIVMSLLQRYISTALLPLAGSAVTLRREMTIFTNHVFNKTESKLNQITTKTMDNVLSWLSLLLGRQKKNEFKLRNDEFITVNSDACVQSCGFMDHVRSAVMANLSGKNQENFLTEVGLAFHGLLMDHFKKYPVSATGGFALTKDLGMYQDTMASYGITVLAERFDLLRQLGNLFVVGADSIKSYLSESTLSKIDARLLRPFLMQRVDYGDYPRKHWDDVCGAPAFAHASPRVPQRMPSTFG